MRIKGFPVDGGAFGNQHVVVWLMPVPVEPADTMVASLSLSLLSPSLDDMGCTPGMRR